LKMQIYNTILGRHAFLKFLTSRSTHFVRHLCSILKTQDFMAGELIFQPGDACTSTRFIFDGRLQYVHARDIEANALVAVDLETIMSHTQSVTKGKAGTSLNSAMPEGSADSVVLARGDCISEPVLWTLWEHAGELASLTNGSCALLDCKTFEEVVTLYPMVLWLSVLYSRQFIIHLNKNLMSDIVVPPDVRKWEPEAIEATVENTVGLPFEDELPPHCAPHVVKACVCLAQDIATNGLDEKRPHHGFTMIIGDGKALAACGKSGFNPFQGHDVRVVKQGGTTSIEAVETLRRNAFHSDGAIVVDGLSGRVVASSWFVGDISLGGMDGGARSRSAKAVAQQAGGCYVIKCSEDSRGKLILHLKKDTRVLSGKLDPSSRTFDV